MTLNIMIVDDEPEICKLLKRYIDMDENYSVCYETDPVKALDRIKKGNFHIVLSDIMMPGMNGIELLRKIKKVDGLIQVVMITAYSTVDKVISCLEIGAADYIMKPFENLDEVKEIVDQIAARLRRWRTVVVESQKLQPYS